MQLSVIIVSYNVKFFLEQCLHALLKATANTQAEIFVVDNASADNTVAYLQPRFPSVCFIANGYNAGFAKANNQALAVAAGRYILFLNPDTIVAEDSLAKCIGFMETHPAAGACGVRMIDGSGRFLPESKRGYPTLPASLYKLVGLTALFPRSRRFAHYYLGHLPEQITQEADVLAGAFFFAAAKALQATGGFDERFFMYGEDIDLSYRIRKAGYTNYYLAETSIIHFKGESAGQESLEHIKHFYGAMGIFAKKHQGGKKAALLHMLIQLFIRFRLLLARRRRAGGAPAAKAGALHTLVAGDPHSTGEATRLLNKDAGTARKISVAAAGADLQAAAAALQVDEVVFCEGALPFKKIIHWMQTLPAGSYKIHASGSGSIVGSNLKSAPGAVLS